MANIKTCINGHNYDSANYSQCPYCPKGNAEASLHTNNSGSMDIELNNKRTYNENTLISEEHNPLSHEPTIISGRSGSIQNNNINSSNRTKIVSLQNENPISVNNNKRKLVGFLVTYTLNQYGLSFKLYEGKNSIGSGSDNDVILENDHGVSRKHLTILFRDGKFRFKDEFSTNATYINGIETEDGYLENFDIIRIGKTNLVFIAIPLSI